MEAAVVEGGADVDDRAVRQHAVQHGLVEAFFHRRDVVLGDGTADYFFGKLIAGAAGEGFQGEADVPVLAVATALFLVLVFGLGGGGDGLFVRDFGGFQLDTDTELARHLIGGDGELGIPHAGENSLVGIGIPPMDEGGVFFHQPGYRRAELVQVGFGLGVNGFAENGRRELDGGYFHRLVRLAEGISGGGHG